jgi:hypothetical protein
MSTHSRTQKFMRQRSGRSQASIMSCGAARGHTSRLTYHSRMAPRRHASPRLAGRAAHLVDALAGEEERERLPDRARGPSATAAP